MYTVTVVGLGYVGLTMAACLADRGLKTTGIDIDSNKIESINTGRSPIHEPQLQELVEKTLRARILKATTDLEDSLRDSDITFVTVGTPSLLDGSISLEYVRSAVESLGRTLKKTENYHLVVVRSTVIPGTCQEVVKAILEKASGKVCGKDFGLCSNPEFLKEGSAVQDMMKPDRVVIGENDKRSGNELEDFYHQLYQSKMPRFIRTSLANAEMIKYANNAFLATKVSFINSLANLCERLPQGDVKTIAEGIGLDPRIGPLFLRAGLGWGGSCFLKDLKAILAYAKTQNIELPIIDATLRINELQPIWAVRKAKEALGELKGKRVALLGLAFKPDTDDIREAVSIRIIETLLHEGSFVHAYDPAAMEKVERLFGKRVSFADSAQECIQDADCCILVTEWNEFKKLTPDDFKRMHRPVLIDGRRLYSPNGYSKKLKYYAVGLGRESQDPSKHS
jgi:UDPglucose 6-dehydrogenase